jgi:hypothetical protein
MIMLDQQIPVGLVNVFQQSLMKYKLNQFILYRNEFIKRKGKKNNFVTSICFYSNIVASHSCTIYHWATFTYNNLLSVLNCKLYP